MDLAGYPVIAAQVDCDSVVRIVPHFGHILCDEVDCPADPPYGVINVGATLLVDGPPSTALLSRFELDPEVHLVGWALVTCPAAYGGEPVPERRRIDPRISRRAHRIRMVRVRQRDPMRLSTY